MAHRRSSRRVVAAVIILASVVLFPQRIFATGGAVYTTVNRREGGSHCKNGNPPINCNIYDAKPYVWLNGGPASNGLTPDGDYFFAVLSPGGQPNPNDGGANNLSDDFDAYPNRTFAVSGGELSAYGGTHDLEAGAHLVRLFPYADTTNPGGVYIMAVCFLGTGYPVDPRSCKYDAFKVQRGRVQVQAFLSGKKYRDDDKSGTLEFGELGLEGWSVRVSNADGTNSVAVTDANGDWSHATAPHAPASGSSTFTVCEDRQAGWRQTGNVADQSLHSEGVSVALSSFCYGVAVPNDAPATADGLNFGNIPQGEISGSKYYDGDQDGRLSLGEAGIPGWRIAVIGSTTEIITTDAGGDFSLVLDPGPYTLIEVRAVHDWIQTGNTVDQSLASDRVTVELSGFAYGIVLPIDRPSAVTGIHFGNVCRVAPGGRTIGFWSNRNGQALLTEGDLEALRDLALVDQEGADFDPSTKEEYAEWLLGATAANMAYMLSAQLSSTYLSSLHGLTDTSLVVDGTLTVSDVIVYADALLVADGDVPGGDPSRPEEERVKNLLDAINSGASFVQPEEEACPKPAFP